MRNIIIAMSLVTVSLMAADYSQMTTDELTSLRGSVPVENREAFRSEMQSRMQAMTPQERAKYRADRGMGKHQGANKGKGQGNGQGTHQRLRDGSGAGRMNQGVDRIQKQQNQGKRQKLKDGSGSGK